MSSKEAGGPAGVNCWSAVSYTLVQTLPPNPEPTAPSAYHQVARPQVAVRDVPTPQGSAGPAPQGLPPRRGAPSYPTITLRPNLNPIPTPITTPTPGPQAHRPAHRAGDFAADEEGRLEYLARRTSWDRDLVLQISGDLGLQARRRSTEIPTEVQGGCTARRADAGRAASRSPSEASPGEPSSLPAATAAAGEEGARSLDAQPAGSRAGPTAGADAPSSPKPRADGCASGSLTPPRRGLWPWPAALLARRRLARRKRLRNDEVLAAAQEAQRKAAAARATASSPPKSDAASGTAAAERASDGSSSRSSAAESGNLDT